MAIGEQPVTNSPVMTVQSTTGWERATYEFDGHTFYMPFGDVAPMLIGLDLAYRARRGDEGAARVLVALNVTIPASGGFYWPARTDAAPRTMSDTSRMLAKAVLAGELEAARALADEIVEQCGGK